MLEFRGHSQVRSVPRIRPTVRARIPRSVLVQIEQPRRGTYRHPPPARSARMRAQRATAVGLQHVHRGSSPPSVTAGRGSSGPRTTRTQTAPADVPRRDMSRRLLRRHAIVPPAILCPTPREACQSSQASGRRPGSRRLGPRTAAGRAPRRGRRDRLPPPLLGHLIDHRSTHVLEGHSLRSSRLSANPSGGGGLGPALKLIHRAFVAQDVRFAPSAHGWNSTEAVAYR